MKFWLVLCCILLATWVLHSWDLVPWWTFYLPYDDDLGYYWHAHNYAMAPIWQQEWWRLASLDGPDQLIPNGDSWFAGLVMHVTGTDMRGWKMVSAVQSVAIAAVYALLARRWFNDRVGLIVAALLGSAWLLMCVDHQGYGDTLRPVLLIGLAMLAAEYKRPVLAGLVCGLCFYTFYSARLALPAALLVLWGRR